MKGRTLKMVKTKKKLSSRVVALLLSVLIMTMCYVPTVAGAFSDKVIADQKMLTGWSYNYEATKYKGIVMYTYWANRIPYFITDDNAVAYCINFTKLNTDSYINKF